jgi:dipeptidyl aminopeptidase/acylaminoacyl peptidase
MKIISKFFFALLSIMGTISASGQESGTVPDISGKSSDAATLIPTALFAESGRVRSPLLSPDGTKLVFREQMADKTYLTIDYFGSSPAYRVAMPEKTDLNWYRWAGNEKLLISVGSLKTYIDVEYRQVELYVIDLLSRKTLKVGPERSGPDGDNVLFVDPEGRYFLQEFRRSIYKYPEVARVDLVTNQSETIVPDQLQIWDWYADSRGTVRMGISYRTRSTLIFYRRTNEEKFKKIGKITASDDEDEIEEELLDINQIVSNSDQGYILSNKETGRFALYKFDYLSRQTGEMIFGHPENDVTSYTLSDDGERLEAVRFTDSRDRINWFEPEMTKHQTMLDKALGDQEAWISSMSKDRSKMVIFSTSSTDPGSYYLYQPAARKMERYAGVNDALDPQQLSVTRYENYKARDGTVIRAYLTIPKRRQGEKKLPLVILPHGGPFGIRDTLDYNSEVQMLADRGYAVLQPNFRGSGGYGEAFYKLGEGQIGRKMQDDLDDAIDWLDQSEIIDPKRVCVVGSSYGGYAALWAVIRNPERYRCAASFAGVTDWRTQLRYDKRFFSSRYSRKWREQIEGEEEFNLDDVSPARNVDRLTRPILLAHGKEDSNVPYSQFKLMKDKLENAGKSAVFVTYEEEGHGLSDKKNAKDWLDQLEKFLGEHNPAH